MAFSCLFLLVFVQFTFSPFCTVNFRKRKFSRTVQGRMFLLCPPPFVYVFGGIFVFGPASAFFVCTLSSKGMNGILTNFVNIHYLVGGRTDQIWCPWPNFEVPGGQEYILFGGSQELII